MTTLSLCKGIDGEIYDAMKNMIQVCLDITKQFDLWNTVSWLANPKQVIAQSVEYNLE